MCTGGERRWKGDCRGLKGIEGEGDWREDERRSKQNREDERGDGSG